jgi:hypothetical protein
VPGVTPSQAPICLTTQGICLYSTSARSGLAASASQHASLWSACQHASLWSASQHASALAGLALSTPSSRACQQGWRTSSLRSARQSYCRKAVS